MRVHRVRQHLISSPIADIEGEVARSLDSLGIDVPRDPVAITSGSRGIANIARITRAAGDWLRSRGADPFIVPAMGSHNGATAEGQRAMIESLGITEAAMNMPIRSSMEAVRIGTVATGDVWMDKHCHESAGVLVLNRVKLHTCFSGPIQSGLVKMMVIGMGKIRAAETFHRAAPFAKKEMLAEMCQCVIGTGKILGGLAILEDGYDETAELRAVRPESMLSTEPELLTRHRHYFPTLPIEDINALIVGEIGKTFSGTGMDTNVIGYRGVRGFEDLDTPRIRAIAALTLSPRSQGNAIGVGLADFITRRLRDAIDERKTFVNVYTTGDMHRMAIPCTLEDDREIVDRIAERFGTERWLFIPNTLHLETLYASEDLAPELRRHERCEVSPDPIELPFDSNRLTLDYSL